MARKNGSFQYSFGNRKVTFNCECCGHRTNNSAHDVFCPPCLELAGLQNSVFDGCFDQWCADERTRLTKTVKGDKNRLLAYMPRLFEAVPE